MQGQSEAGFGKSNPNLEIYFQKVTIEAVDGQI
jgi:hypothetical protein